MFLDLHADTLEKILDEKKSLSYNDCNFDINRAKHCKNYIQCLACFINTEYENKKQGFYRSNKLLDSFYKEYEKYKDNINLIKEKNDIENRDENKVGIILTVENGSAIDGKIENVEKLYNRGIRMMSITWNNDNELGTGAHTTNDTGLTNLGIKYIKELERLNIVIDLAHASEKCFYDVCSLTNKSVIVSHTGVYNLCEHPRNLKDNQIKEIAKKNGVIGICLYKDFITKNEKFTSKDIANHIDYIVNLVGIDYVCLGSDFDGIAKDKMPLDIQGVQDYENLLIELKRRGYSSNEIEKISGKNFMRIL